MGVFFAGVFVCLRGRWSLIKIVATPPSAEAAATPPQTRRRAFSGDLLFCLKKPGNRRLECNNRFVINRLRISADLGQAEDAGQWDRIVKFNVYSVYLVP